MQPNERWIAAQRWVHKSTYGIDELITAKIATLQMRGKDWPALQLYQEGDNFFEQERWQEAEQRYQEALEHEPNDNETQVWLWNAIGRTLERMGKISEAKAAYEQSIALYYNFVPPHRNLGLLYKFHLNDNTNARRCLERALIIEPKRLPELYTDIGNLEWEEGQVEAAERNYRKSIEINPDYYPGLNNLYGILLQRALQNRELTISERKKALLESANLMLRLLDCAPPKSPEVHGAIHNGPLMAEHLNNIALALREKRDFNGTSECMIQAIQIVQRLRRKDGE